MLPTDSALDALPEDVRQSILGSRSKSLQLAAFHVWAGASPFSALVGNAAQTKVRPRYLSPASSPFYSTVECCTAL